jgi:hypothetical protein
MNARSRRWSRASWRYSSFYVGGGFADAYGASAHPDRCRARDIQWLDGIKGMAAVYHVECHDGSDDDPIGNTHDLRGTAHFANGSQPRQGNFHIEIVISLSKLTQLKNQN